MAVESSIADLKAALERTAEALQRKLNHLLPRADGPDGRLCDAMRYATLDGGKRMRPFLVVTSAEMFGVGREAALRTAAAVECLHSYSLVHDDLPCMDDDDIRRGKPATHKAFDEATAILAGDALLTLAFEILGDERTHPDPRVRAELMRSLAVAAGCRGMVGGQMMDLMAETQNFDLMTVTRLQQLKTGALISFAAESGAILGRTNGVKRQALRYYAHDMGLAYQIADDLLDVDGDEAVLGKTPGKDARAGKATLVSVLGKERARMQAEMLTEQAIAHLDPFDDKAALLHALARFAINRDR
ncbi:MAG: polyprenyl synthetase family protein [Sphingomonadales bacterium]